MSGKLAGLFNWVAAAALPLGLALALGSCSDDDDNSSQANGGSAGSGGVGGIVVYNPCPDPTCNKTRLDAIREAAGEFLNDPRSAGIGVGINYFGFNPIGSASCNVADYSNAAVGVGVLPDHTNAIMQSLNGIQPTGETPSAAGSPRRVQLRPAVESVTDRSRGRDPALDRRPARSARHLPQRHVLPHARGHGSSGDRMRQR